MPFVRNTGGFPPDTGSGSSENTAPAKAKKAEVEYFPSEPKYCMDDLIVTEKVHDELQTIIEAERCWKQVFDDWGLGSVMADKRNLFVNLYGEPGTGKTMAAHAIAHSLNKKMICVNYAEIESKYVGETSKNLTKLFRTAQEKNVIIFFDEADAFLSKRVTNMSSSTDVSVNQTRSVLLTLLNDYKGMVIFATNFISNYDVAFMRRIHYHVRFELPNLELRKKLWHRYMPPKMPTDADIDVISGKFDGISGSDISTAVLKAALKSARLGNGCVKSEFIEEAVTSILNSKNENTPVTVTKRVVSEEYALSQIKKANGGVLPAEYAKENNAANDIESGGQT